MSQLELAKKSGVAQGYISALEAGTKDLPPKKWTISDLRKGADLGSS